jgi:hypothetical protein
MADLHDTGAYKIVPGSFLSTKNTTKLTVYLWKETVKRKADHAQKKISMLKKKEGRCYSKITISVQLGFVLPSNNNIHSVVLARSNYKKTLNYSHQPRKELNQPTRTCEQG